MVECVGRRPIPLLSVALTGVILAVSSTLMTGCGVNGPFEGKPVRVASNPAAPGTPTGLALTAISDDSVLVTWDAPVGGTPLVVSYEVGLDYEQEADLPASVTSHTFTGIGSGERHTATLTALGTANNSRTATTWISMPPDTLPTSAAVPTSAVPTTAVPKNSASTSPAPTGSATDPRWNSGWG
jgi:hypothetical protein